MANLNETVGARIKLMRKQRGLKQEHLARYLNIDQAIVSKIENGQRPIGAAMLESLCDLFFCSLDDLLEGNLDTTHTHTVAFRADSLSADDVHAIAAIGRIAHNIEEMITLEKAANDGR